jgi:cbb3-type cytochrome oxidase maturation protein
MSSLVFLVPISLVLLGVAIWAFVWAVRLGQFDDLETPAVQILVDEPRACRNGHAPEAASGDTAAAEPGTRAQDALDDHRKPLPRAD